MTKFFSLLLALSLVAPAGARAADKSKNATSPTKGTCYVCKYNRDLACVEFTVKPNTPRLTHAGKEYCFCGDDCRKEFAKTPDKYAPRTR